jgi:SAM-dependent methyltransferase
MSRFEPTTGGVKLAPFNPTSTDAISTALRFAGLKAGETALDIGCGDGRVLVALATACPEAQVVGIEYSAELCSRAEARIAEAGVGNARVICGDATLVQPSDVDVVFAYLTPTGLVAVEPFLARLVQGPRRTRVISNAFTVPGWAEKGWLQETVRDKHGLALYRYCVPASAPEEAGGAAAPAPAAAAVSGGSGAVESAGVPASTAAGSSTT